MELLLEQIEAIKIAYGFTSLENDGLQKLNLEFKEDVWTEPPHKLKHFYNYLQLAPALSALAFYQQGLSIGYTRLLKESYLKISR